MTLQGEKKREYQRKWLAKRREDYLSDKSCVICGSTEYLQIDHIDPDTKITHRVWSWSNERREEELEKCQILCSEHHKRKTAQYLNSLRKECKRDHDISLRNKWGGCRECKRITDAELRQSSK